MGALARPLGTRNYAAPMTNSGTKKGLLSGHRVAPEPIGTGVSVADLGRSLELARAVSDARAKRTADVIRTRIADQAR